MTDRLLDEYKYVQKVVRSCVTEAQLENAKKWAEDWAWRMKAIYPNKVLSASDLYLSVVSI